MKSVRNKITDQVRVQVTDAVSDQVYDQVSGQVEIQVWNRVIEKEVINEFRNQSLKTIRKEIK